MKEYVNYKNQGNTNARKYDFHKLMPGEHMTMPVPTAEDGQRIRSALYMASKRVDYFYRVKTRGGFLEIWCFQNKDDRIPDNAFLSMNPGDYRDCVIPYTHVPRVKAEYQKLRKLVNEASIKSGHRYEMNKTMSGRFVVLQVWCLGS